MLGNISFKQYNFFEMKFVKKRFLTILIYHSRSQRILSIRKGKVQSFNCPFVNLGIGTSALELELEIELELELILQTPLFPVP